MNGTIADTDLLLRELIGRCLDVGHAGNPEARVGRGVVARVVVDVRRVAKVGIGFSQ